MPKLGIRLLLTAAVLALLSSSCRSAESQQTLVLFGFSAMEDVMKESIIPAFRAEMKEATGRDVHVVTSFAGSGTITNQILFGAPAQIVMLATESDASLLRAAGLVTTDWSSLPQAGTYAYSVVIILTRDGNPLGLQSFDDLAADGIDVVYPDPTTSGGAQWAILALYGSAFRATEVAAGGTDPDAAARLLAAVSSNTTSLPESARRALTQFKLGFGDALLTYENEALLDIRKGEPYEIVVPVSTIRIEPKVVIVDRNVDAGQAALVTAFVDFLWSPMAQAAFADGNFRVADAELMRRHAGIFTSVERSFTVEDLGGWSEAVPHIIEGVWRTAMRGLN